MFDLPLLITQVAKWRPYDHDDPAHLDWRNLYMYYTYPTKDPLASDVESRVSRSWSVYGFHPGRIVLDDSPTCIKHIIIHNALGAVSNGRSSSVGVGAVGTHASLERND